MSAGSPSPTRRRRSLVAAALALLVPLALACGGGRDEAASPDPTPEPDMVAGGELPERDVSGIDVCATVPAEALAEVIGWPVAEAPWRMDYDPAPNCTYRLRGSSGSGERFDILLQDLFDYDWAREAAETFDREVIDIEGLGSAAYWKKTPDGWCEVWAKRRDGLVVNTMANERDQAIAAARLALERIP